MHPCTFSKRIASFSFFTNSALTIHMDESHRCTLKRIAIHAQSVSPFSGSLQYLESVRITEDGWVSNESDACDEELQKSCRVVEL